MYCTYKEDGCGWIGVLKDLNAHLEDETPAVAENCQFFPVACTLCDAPIQRKSMLDHRNLHCPKRLACCEFCDDYISDYADLIQNHIPKCDFVAVKCLNAGCDEQMQRIALSEHVRVCPESIIRCELASLGCNDSFQRNEMHDHYNRMLPFHMSLMVTHGSMERQELTAKLVHLESENKILHKKLEMTSDAVDVLRKENGSLSLDRSRTMDDVKMFNHEVVILKKKLSQEIQKSSLLSGKLDKLENEHKEREQSCNILRCQVSHNTDDMKCLASYDASGVKVMRENMAVLEKETGSVINKVIANQTTIKSLEEKLEELEDLCSITLTSRMGSYPVTIVLRDFSTWQILNTEWSSPSFYFKGYKLCLSAFVNGDPAKNVNGYLTLYVHLMKGEDDNKLSWPFHQTVTLELLHPDPSQTNKKEVLSFNSRTDTKYTKRVVGQKQAKGWGYPDFIPHFELNKFLRGRRDFLMIRVS